MQNVYFVKYIYIYCKIYILYSWKCTVYDTLFESIYYMQYILVQILHNVFLIIYIYIV